WTGKYLAAGNNLGEILVWNTADLTSRTPVPIRQLVGHANCITRLVSTSDGRALISASYDRSICVWDLAAATSGRAAKIVLNARALAEASRRNTSRKPPAPLEVQVHQQEPALTWREHRDWVQALALSRDETWLISGDDSGLVILRERGTGKIIRQWTTRGWVYALALAPDKKHAFVSERVPLVFDSGRYDAAKVWNLDTCQPVLDLSKDFKGMYLSTALYSPDGKWLAVGRGGEVDGPNGRVFILDPVTGKRIRELSPGHLYGLTDMLLYPDGEHLFTCGRDTLIRIWHVPSGKLVRELGQSRGGQFKDWIHAIALSPDGRWLAAGDMAGAVQLWQLAE
ncbi:MAG: hypothetical protein RMJ19_11165, partial [Gemmatales bacterium]|nr:hypothetical protein [Gemmatales bacterium]MDW8176223.1 hypothetical protein [Gemmatales bacterium]